MKIKADFTNSGAPALGLSPTIRIREIPNVLVVTDEAMTELGDGSYFYDYTDYNVKKDYSIRCDGGVSLSDTERYKFAGNENYYDDVASSVWSAPVTASYLTDGSFGGTLQRMAGLMHENIYIDNPIYNGAGNLTSARVRIYSVPGSVGTANNVIGTYEITAPGETAGQFTNWSQIRQ